MTIIYSLLIFLATFFFMEFMAWFTHKYIMHGFLWSLHKDHHVKDHKSWFERNDAFFIFYAIVSIICFYLWSYHNIWFTLAIGLGIMAYGATYFIVHDIFIHQRFKCLGKPIIGMLKELEGLTKFITNILVKKTRMLRYAICSSEVF